MLLFLCVSRFGTSVAPMVYAGSLPVLLSAWKMTAAQAGSIQSATASLLQDSTSLAVSSV
jgi:hypothetical protein